MYFKKYAININLTMSFKKLVLVLLKLASNTGKSLVCSTRKQHDCQLHKSNCMFCVCKHDHLHFCCVFKQNVEFLPEVPLKWLPPAFFQGNFCFRGSITKRNKEEISSTCLKFLNIFQVDLIEKNSLRRKAMLYV